MNLSLILLSLSGIFYGASFTAHLFSFSGHLERDTPAVTFMRLGFLFGTFYFAVESIQNGFFLPVVNLAGALAFFAWSLAFVYLVLLARIQSESFGLVLTPILSLLIAAAYFKDLNGPHAALPGAGLLNPYFIVHIISAFFAYASFAISFAAGILYLIQHHQLKTRSAGAFYHKLPSLEELERLIYQPLLWGTPLLFAATAIGFLWSKSAFGEYWILDPKTIATAIAVFFYFMILCLRFVTPVRGKQVAVLSLLAFVFVLFSFVGTRFISGSHPY